MASPAQITANRVNAQSSTGPRTEEGKARVAQNRATHGLTGRNVTLTGEDAQAFDVLLTRLHTEYFPRTAAEAALVDHIALAQWRLARIAGWEAQLFTESLEGDPAAPSALMKMFSKTGDPAEALARIQRYEASTRRAWHAALKELRESKLTQAAAEETGTILYKPTLPPDELPGFLRRSNSNPISTPDYPQLGANLASVPFRADNFRGQ